MDLFELAKEASRQEDFEGAHDYYVQVMEEEGFTPKLLTGISTTFYLEKINYNALLFGIASIHLTLYASYQALLAGDENIKHLLDEVPEDMREEFPHSIGMLILHQPDILTYFGHVAVDHEQAFEKNPDIRKFAEVYYARLLSKEKFEAKLKEHDLTREEVNQKDISEYIPIGIKTIIENINWAEIENNDIAKLYLD